MSLKICQSTIGSAGSALLAVLALSSCQLIPSDVANLPSELSYGDSPLQVKLTLGSPQRKEDWIDKSDRNQLGEIWHYQNDWHHEPGLFDVNDGFGSWDLYFDRTQHLVGWKLVEPLPSQGRAREQFWTDHLWEGRAEMYLSNFLRDKSVRRADDPLSSTEVRCFAQACLDLDLGLKGFPRDVRHWNDVRYLRLQCQSFKDPSRAQNPREREKLVNCARQLKSEL